MNRALIVDDDPDIRDFLRRVTEDEGFTCQEAGHGIEALVCMRSFQAGLILVDLKMPKMSGNEFIERIRKEYVDTPPHIVVITGHAGYHDEKLKRCVDYILTKPVNDRQLRGLLQGYYNPQEATPRKQLRVLVADDSRIYRLKVKSILLRFDFDVVESESGTDALQFFNNEGPFDLVITDENMPGLSGIELVSAIREKDSRIPILMVTAQAAQIDAAKEAGISGWLIKPTSEDQVVAALEGILPEFSDSSNATMTTPSG